MPGPLWSVSDRSRDQKKVKKSARAALGLSCSYQRAESQCDLGFLRHQVEQRLLEKRLAQSLWHEPEGCYEIMQGKAK